jgi:cation:H+ antiporter
MKRFLPLALAILACLPGLHFRLAGIHIGPPETALMAGTAILGASFLLLWACDVAQLDIPQALALAVVALIAVLPEYAVDMYFTWQAGKHPEGEYVRYAIANMTGANRLLIGVAWTAIALIHWLRTRRTVVLEEARRTEVFFLGLATAYALVLPLKGTLAWYDGVAFISLYLWYIRLAGKRPCEECELEGTAEIIATLPQSQRRLTTVVLFLFAAGVILANAEPFSEGLVATGKQFGINEFLLVQWLAPIASEAPEFIVAIMFVLRGQAGTALGSLLSAKLNQWTLLVGMIPGVYGLARGSLAHPIPMSGFQMHELLLTAAQSLFAVVLLADLGLGLPGALVLFVLFTGQLLSPVFLDGHPGFIPGVANGDEAHVMFSLLYLAAALFVFARRPRDVLGLRRGLNVDAPSVCEARDA